MRTFVQQIKGRGGQKVMFTINPTIGADTKNKAKHILYNGQIKEPKIFTLASVLLCLCE